MWSARHHRELSVKDWTGTQIFISPVPLAWKPLTLFLGAKLSWLILSATPLVLIIKVIINTATKFLISSTASASADNTEVIWVYSQVVHNLRFYDMSSQTLPIYLITLMVQSSCKFYHDLICRLFEYASLYLFSLRESKAGEHGGCFGSTGFAGFLAGAFISPGLKPASFFEALPLLVPCPRQGGVWITLHAPKADFCLPWAWGATYCC